MNIFETTDAYERWLATFMKPVAGDVRLKHESMRADAFTFFRATFYLWAHFWQGLPAPVTEAPRVLAMGDAHVENFGTWVPGEMPHVFVRSS
jgi:uncharacterized protein (DUF2252 family)